jgi:hypothetical protein
MKPTFLYGKTLGEEFRDFFSTTLAKLRNFAIDVGQKLTHLALRLPLATELLK